MFGKRWKSVGYITQDPNDHFELDEPIKVGVKKFTAAEKFSSAKKQIELEKDDVLLTLKGYGLLR